MDDAKTPAARIVERFGVEALSRWTGRHRSRVHAWTWSTDKGGTGGSIPLRLRPKIIAGAREDLGEDLCVGDFELLVGERYLVPEDVQ